MQGISLRRCLLSVHDARYGDDKAGRGMKGSDNEIHTLSDRPHTYYSRRIKQLRSGQLADGRCVARVRDGFGGAGMRMDSVLLCRGSERSGRTTESVLLYSAPV